MKFESRAAQAAPIALLLPLLAAGAILIWWIVGTADRGMRDDLLQQARMIAQAVDVGDVKALAGTTADSNSPVYLRLKDQLAAVQASSPRCRFVYLLGHKADGRIFFFADSEPPGSKDYSPPGQIYNEAPKGFHRAFATTSAITEGPYTDRWGTWVSALVPILDRRPAAYNLSSPQAAQAMVLEAKDFYLKNGRERLVKEINNPLGQFHRGELYAFAYDRNMTLVAHPTKPELVGQNLIDRKDWSGGRYFRREIQKVTKSKGAGWVGYEYENPLTKQRDHKTAYVKAVDDLIVCAGAYTGETVSVLAMDFDAGAWKWKLVRAALPPGLLTVSLATIGLISLSARRYRTSNVQANRLRRLPPVLAAATGVTLTLFSAWILHERETHSRNDAFAQLAASWTKAIAETFNDLHDTGMEGLARFYEHSPEITREEFAKFSPYLTKDPGIQAWEWVPAVPASEKSRFESAAHASGHIGFEIWQKNAQGKRVPASGRATYYPVFHVAPLAGNEAVLGYDVGSELLRRTALESAERTGLTTATDPITLVPEKGRQMGMLICRPVFDSANPKHLRGFAVAVVRMETLLTTSIPDNSAIIDLSFLRRDGAPQLLASTGITESSPIPHLKSTRCIFAFGKIFSATASADPQFLRLHPVRAGWIALITGLALTTAVSFVFSQICRRREELEQMVYDRTVELRESERFANATVNALSDHLAILDETGKIIAVNRTWRDFASTNSLDVSNLCEGADYLAVCHAALERGCIEAGTFAAGIRSVLDDEQSEFIMEYSCDSPNERRWFIGRVTRFRGKGDVRLVVAHENITSRKLAEEAAVALALRNKVLLQTGSDGLHVLNERGNVVEVNDAFCSMLGYTREEMLGLNIVDWAVNWSKEEVTQRFRQRLESPGLFITHQRTKNGRILTVEINARGVTLENQIYLYASVRDVTERTKAEQDLRMLWQAVVQSPTTVVITNADGQIEYVNPKFVETTGYSVAEAVGQNPRILKSNSHPRNFYVAMWQTLLRGDVWQGEIRNRRKNGELYWETACISPVRDPNGKITHYIAIKEDITERKRVAEELVRAKEVAESANQAKSEFLANMSHEIRTPMNGVLGMVGLLLDTSLTETQRRYAQTARTSGETLLALLNDILDFSKIEAGKLELEHLNFSLHNLLDDFVGMMAMRALEKELVLGCVVAPEVPSDLQGDPGRLRQILINLASNAIKFTEQGEVVIRVGVVSQTPSEVRLRFEVRDTGIGIPTDRLVRLFEKFSQVDSSTTRTHGGSGLGLAICKQLTQLMNGQIGVHTEAGKGSDFWFEVLLAKQSSRVPQPIFPADLHGVHVLIVDDRPVNREILMVLLGSWGMRPAEAVDGPSALQALTQAKNAHDPFAIAVLDMHMPGMDGKSLGRVIKADLNLRDTRLVMCSSLGQMGGDLRLDEIGFAASLTKPVRRQELFQVLTDVVGGTLIAPSRVIPGEGFALARGLSQSRILVAEDNITNQQVAVGILTKLGLAVDVAGSGQEALKALASVAYDLVLMDVQMPDMDGLAATKAIRNPQSPVLNHQVAVIAMTAHAMQGDRQRCLEAGMNDYLTKPIERQALIAMLEKWLKPKDIETANEIVRDVSTAEDARIPVFDRVAFMKMLFEDATVASLIVAEFVKDTGRRIESIKRHLEIRDVKEIELETHTVKGASATIRAEALRQVAYKMEYAARDGNLELVGSLLPDMESQWERLQIELAQPLTNG